MSRDMQKLTTYTMLENQFLIFEADNKFYLGVIIGKEVDGEMELDKGTYNFILRREGKPECKKH